MYYVSCSSITYLFEEGGAKSFLSERISQDPLEKFFGRQRQRGAVNENPSVHQFLQNNQSLRVVDSIKVDTSEGNTCGTNTSKITVTSGFLPKRRQIAETKYDEPTVEKKNHKHTR